MSRMGVFEQNGYFKNINSNFIKSKALIRKFKETFLKSSTIEIFTISY